MSRIPCHPIVASAAQCAVVRLTITSWCLLWAKQVSKQSAINAPCHIPSPSLQHFCLTGFQNPAQHRQKYTTTFNMPTAVAWVKIRDNVTPSMAITSVFVIVSPAGNMPCMCTAASQTPQTHGLAE